jgi:2'-5' RNA ligase
LPVNGLFVLAELSGEAAELIRAIQREFDPKLAAVPAQPHVTLVGSSGVGPIRAGTTAAELAGALAPIAAATAPFSVSFERPTRYMQTNTVVLPLDAHGPLRRLHEDIARSGLRFERVRFTFSPHVTLSLYPTLGAESLRRLLAERVDAGALITSITVYRTPNPYTSTKVMELQLTAGS